MATLHSTSHSTSHVVGEWISPRSESSMIRVDEACLVKITTYTHDMVLTISLELRKNLGQETIN